MRSITAAVLVAGGLSVTLTGAAWAGEPDDDDRDVVIVTCVDGEAVVRELSEEERERLRARPAPADGVRVQRARPAEPGVRPLPAEPGEPPEVACPAEAAPPLERGAIEVVPALPSPR